MILVANTVKTMSGERAYQVATASGRPGERPAAGASNGRRRQRQAKLMRSRFAAATGAAEGRADLLWVTAFCSSCFGCGGLLQRLHAAAHRHADPRRGRSKKVGAIGRREIGSGHD